MYQGPAAPAAAAATSFRHHQHDDEAEYERELIAETPNKKSAKKNNFFSSNNTKNDGDNDDDGEESEAEKAIRLCQIGLGADRDERLRLQRLDDQRSSVMKRWTLSQEHVMQLSRDVGDIGNEINNEFFASVNKILAVHNTLRQQLNNVGSDPQQTGRRITEADFYFEMLAAQQKIDDVMCDLTHSVACTAQRNLRFAWDRVDLPRSMETPLVAQLQQQLAENAKLPPAPNHAPMPVELEGAVEALLAATPSDPAYLLRSVDAEGPLAAAAISAACPPKLRAELLAPLVKPLPPEGMRKMEQLRQLGEAAPALFTHPSFAAAPPPTAAAAAGGGVDPRLGGGGSSAASSTTGAMLAGGSNGGALLAGGGPGQNPHKRIQREMISPANRVILRRMHNERGVRRAIADVTAHLANTPIGQVEDPVEVAKRAATQSQNQQQAGAPLQMMQQQQSQKNNNNNNSNSHRAICISPHVFADARNDPDLFSKVQDCVFQLMQNGIWVTIGAPANADEFPTDSKRIFASLFATDFVGSSVEHKTLAYKQAAQRMTLRQQPMKFPHWAMDIGFQHAWPVKLPSCVGGGTIGGNTVEQQQQHLSSAGLSEKVHDKAWFFREAGLAADHPEENVLKPRMMLNRFDDAAPVPSFDAASPAGGQQQHQQSQIDVVLRTQQQQQQQTQFSQAPQSDFSSHLRQQQNDLRRKVMALSQQQPQQNNNNNNNNRMMMPSQLQQQQNKVGAIRRQRQNKNDTTDPGSNQPPNPFDAARNTTTTFDDTSSFLNGIQQQQQQQHQQFHQNQFRDSSLPPYVAGGGSLSLARTTGGNESLALNLDDDDDQFGESLLLELERNFDEEEKVARAQQQQSNQSNSNSGDSSSNAAATTTIQNSPNNRNPMRWAGGDDDDDDEPIPVDPSNNNAASSGGSVKQEQQQQGQQQQRNQKPGSKNDAFIDAYNSDLSSQRVEFRHRRMSSVGRSVKVGGSNNKAARRSSRGAAAAAGSRPGSRAASEASRSRPSSKSRGGGAEEDDDDDPFKDSSSSARAKKRVRPGPSIWNPFRDKVCFAFSPNVKKEERSKCQTIIEALGCTRATGPTYNAMTTHLITKAGNEKERTEKYLSFIAAGKPIVSTGYLLDCEDAGMLLDEKGYCPATDLPQIDPSFRLGPDGMMRTMRPNEVPAGSTALPFRDWRVLLFANPSVASGISTILAAGGCQMHRAVSFTTKDEYAQPHGASWKAEMMKEHAKAPWTHILVEMSHTDSGLPPTNVYVPDFFRDEKNVCKHYSLELIFTILCSPLVKQAEELRGVGDFRWREF